MDARTAWWLLGCGLLAAALLFCVNPADSTLFPPCPSRQWAGLYCPGCGSLRACHQLLHANLPAAFRFNPILLPGLPLLGWLLLRRPGPMPTRVTIGIAIVIIAYGIARNLPNAPAFLIPPPAEPAALSPRTP